MFGLDKDFGSLHPSFLDIFGTTFFKKDGLSSSMNPDFQRDLNLDSQSLFFQDESGLEGWKGNPWDRLAGSTDGHRSHPGPSCSCLSSRTEPEVRGLGWVPGGSSHTEPEEVRKRRCRRSGPSLPPSLALAAASSSPVTRWVEWASKRVSKGPSVLQWLTCFTFRTIQTWKVVCQLNITCPRNPVKATIPSTAGIQPFCRKVHGFGGGIPASKG